MVRETVWANASVIGKGAVWSGADGGRVASLGGCHPVEVLYINSVG